ncbi:GNAT family N-acetyltransferase [Nocardioides marmorisolisilvae]|uniref:GNAT family N-acetyltransferase n=1 Tax=Nocardioides marmorisolisilvae TaxID=1542737 RepID=A0A3N0DVT3_9ACTN|nr:GNAT family N-acetyltransferase [Nocardioides marmorisolisilvae]RNL79714.1 GNAT family N-acetyltransferase [Nocardioides marmorisolisilvae]
MPTDDVADLVLRPGTAEDIEEIAELFLATRRDAVPQMPPVVSDDEKIRTWFRENVESQEYWLAEDGDILGYAMLDGPWLNALYVGPHRQGSGIGAALLDLVKAQRPDGFGLWVFASNDRARSFYHRNGLIELEHTDGSGNSERSPDIRMVWPGQEPLAFLRSQIDEVDGELALLLARRFALTTAVQGFKENPGQSGRDAEREAEIVARMAAHAPGLGVAALSRIMHTVIGESLDAYERDS